VAPTPSNGFGFFEDRQMTIREVSAQGTITTVAGHGAATPWAVGAPVGDGGSARDALVDPYGRGLVSTPEGGWIFTESARVRLVTESSPARLSAAVVSLSGGVRAPLIHMASTAEGTARVTLRTADGRIAASARQAIAAGDGSIQLSTVSAGRYWLDLTVTDSANRFTSQRLAVVLGPILPITAARRAVAHRVGLFQESRIGECRRVSPRRIDCRARTPRRCTGIYAVTLRSSFTFVRRYTCRAGIRRSPRWLDSAEPWPALGKTLSLG
jgi:hypothetical protein